MRTMIDEEQGTVTVLTADGAEATYPLASAAGFAAASRAWLRAGWDAKHVYSFTWLGRPVIQLPEDLGRAQELVHAIAPDVLIETGVAHGGSLIFYASLFEAMGRGRVIGVDIDLRADNRAAILAHRLAHRITLVDGSSVDPEVVAQVRELIRPDERVMVVLDACHTTEHVLAELRAYAPLVPVGGYVIAADGIMQDVVGAPRTSREWATDNPQAAARRFVAEDCRFTLEPPPFAFNEGVVDRAVTYWPGGHVRRVR